MTRLAFALVASFALPAVASADEPTCPEGAICLEDVVVDARLHAPQAVFVLPRSSAPERDADLETSFVPHVVRAVRDRSF